MISRFLICGALYISLGMVSNIFTYYGKFWAKKDPLSDGKNYNLYNHFKGAYGKVFIKKYNSCLKDYENTLTKYYDQLKIHLSENREQLSFDICENEQKTDCLIYATIQMCKAGDQDQCEDIRENIDNWIKKYKFYHSYDQDDKISEEAQGFHADLIDSAYEVLI